ncbi:FUSC family protein [Muricauda sp. 334s03]|uniref:FUSC family protein n=1 Tax=Flagellimonas yonaguniensis TaxID=3031325 RepID=A0ABT5Y1G4_9FLAO|nr:FUSC family protein [[Muricauda] yonaguniensis]MDF0717193.1 FUSC family protein [[Muricauda] yonaguniensis]
MALKNKIGNELSLFFTLRETQKKWYIPLLAAICVGIPLLIGLYFGNLRLGLMGSLGGLVILYLPESGSRTSRFVTILVASFAFIISFSIGQFFSFHPIAAIGAMGIFTFLVHWIVLVYKTSPPRSFFFIMIAALSICQPFHLETIPTKIGALSLGTMLASILATIHILWSTFKSKEEHDGAAFVFQKNAFADVWEAIVMAVFMAGGLAIGYALGYQNPYWIPVSTAAVMQGASLYHIWQKTVYRILGTFIGLGFCWVLLNFVNTPLEICLSIIVLQFIIEVLIARHYALAVIFITPMTIFLSEAASPLMASPDTLIELRFWEIAIGSILGAFGGWLLYKEKIRFSTLHGLKRIKVTMEKRSKNL